RNVGLTGGDPRRLRISNSGNLGRREFLVLTGSATLSQVTRRISGLPSNKDRIVVLTFDDAVKSQRAFVAPLLKDLGFGATFFVCHRWMSQDPEHNLTWREIAEIHQMGFEIGNHSWTHPPFSVPRDAARLPAELALVELELRQVGVPRPTSFAWCGNVFGPEGVQQLTDLGYRLARRGMQPEVPYGKIEVGPTFNPQKHHPLLIPTTGDAYPGWRLEHFRRVVEHAQNGQIVVFQFHGVPDPHPWVNTPPERFREYMDYLKQQGFRVVALRDLERYLPNTLPRDPLLRAPFSGPPNLRLVLPTEMEATRAELSYWLNNMIYYHHYTQEEVAKVAGLSIDVLRSRAEELGLDENSQAEPHGTQKTIRVQPYPGGRHPRIGFLEGAILPQRGTKASVFLPWDPTSYVVIDLPEAIFSNLGLTFLGHTHIPTIWDERNIWLENVDWKRNPDGSLTGSRVLPNKITFGASVQPATGKVEMDLWLRNDSSERLNGLRTQICAMLKGVPDSNASTNDNKIFRNPVCAVSSTKGSRWILMAWDRCGRAWGNPLVPCMHADPILADCRPGQTVRVRGRLWFYEGDEIQQELERARGEFSSLPTRDSVVVADPELGVREYPSVRKSYSHIKD
ncbi:MAG: polysaccharide deacetylase family protein, partial [Acidobacteria bacterium]|nr:polysaccharide deacetylase family protein [Acidobacteriota bacterium]